MSAGPDPRDVAELTRLFGLMRDFPSDEQRARYLLSSNWLRDRGAEAARINAEQLAAVQTASPAGGSDAYVKITDLEAFALGQVLRPYAPILGYEQRLTRLPLPLDALPAFIEARPEWWERVVHRLARCHFTIPDYVQHPLVDLLRSSGAVRASGDRGSS
jgi:hypothetical protein